jgi:hypothetical protein
MLRFPDEQMLYQGFKAPRPLHRFLRLAADYIYKSPALFPGVSPPAYLQCHNASIFAVPQIDSHSLFRLFNSYNIGAFPRIVIVKDEGGGTVFQMLDKCMLDRIFPYCTVFPAAFFFEVDAVSVQGSDQRTIKRLDYAFGSMSYIL